MAARVAEYIFDMALKDFPNFVQKNETVAMDGCVLLALNNSFFFYKN